MTTSGDRHDPPDPASAAARVVVRPLSNPLALGFSALTVGTLLVAGQQLRWIPVDQQHHVALALVALVAPLQLVACLMGFAVRDVSASTGMGLLSGTWATIGVNQLIGAPGRTSAALGLTLVIVAAVFLVPAAGAAVGKIAPATVLGLVVVRFATTGVYEWTGASAWRITTGVVGCALALAALYTAMAVELEGACRRTVLPLGRIGRDRRLSTGSLDQQLAHVAHEPGVREQL